MSNLHSDKGFTLIELLTTVVVVSILSTLIILAINPLTAVRRQNDNKRLTDLKILSAAIEEYYQDNSLTYPDSGAKTTTRKSNLLPTGNTGPLQKSNSQGWIKQDFGDRLSNLPTDPINTSCNIYRYRVSSDGKYYKLDTILQYYTSKMDNSVDGGTDSTHYEVGNDPVATPIDMGSCP